MINVNIKDGLGSNRRASVISGSRGNGIVVYSFGGDIKTVKYPDFASDTSGTNLNIDGNLAGTPDNIHNGTDNAYWTASTLVGNASDFTYDSTDQAFDGTRSIQTTASENNDTALFARGSTIDLADYRTLTGRIYINDWSTSGDKDIVFQFRNGGITTGTEVRISNYINTGLTGTWQQFIMPLTDFFLGSTVIDEMTFRMIDTGGGPAPGVYFDVLQLQEDTPGANEEFYISPTSDELWAVEKVSIVLADNITGAVANGTMPGLAYDQILGVSGLSNGLIFQVRTNGEIGFSKTALDLLDILDWPGLTSMIPGSDGTNTFVKIEKVFDTPFLLYGNKNDKISIFVNDDLTGLLRFRASALISVLTNEG